MLETIKTILSCKLCEKILDRPVILPCGETVCGKHEEQFKSRETARCKICDKDHELGESENFITNKVVECFLAGEISRLDFGENYKQAFKLLTELNDAQANYDEIKGTSEGILLEKCQAMRNKVDLIREEIIQKVNNCSKKVLADIDSYEANCKLNLSYLDSKLEENNSFDLSEMKADLSDWKTRMNNLYYDKELYHSVCEKSGKYLKFFENSIEELMDEIFLCQEKKFEFDTKYANIFAAFGKSIGFNT